MIYKKIEIAVDGYKETADLYTYFLDNSIEMHINTNHSRRCKRRSFPKRACGNARGYSGTALGWKRASVCMGETRRNAS